MAAGSWGVVTVAVPDYFGGISGCAGCMESEGIMLKVSKWPRDIKYDVIIPCVFCKTWFATQGSILDTYRRCHMIYDRVHCSVECCWRKPVHLHGIVDFRIYQTWMGMRSRCYDEGSVAYRYYGAKGVKMCDEWAKSFLMFEEWAAMNGYRDNLTIERKDPYGDYEPDNCCWIPRADQANNKRRHHPPKPNREPTKLASKPRLKGKKYQLCHA
jgi:hypothetical protein